MIEANRSIDGVSPLHEAQLRNSLRQDCSMHQQLSGKFAFCLNLTSGGHVMMSCVQTPSFPLILSPFNIWYNSSSMTFAMLRHGGKKIMRKGAGAILHPLHLLQRLLPLRGLCSLTMQELCELCVTLYLRAWLSVLGLFLFSHAHRTDRSWWPVRARGWPDPSCCSNLLRWPRQILSARWLARKTVVLARP